jgi:hypothetical protein
VVALVIVAFIVGGEAWFIVLGIGIGSVLEALHGTVGKLWEKVAVLWR